MFGALAIEALTKLVNVAGTFNPGNIGTYEGGNMLIVKMFGLSGAAGIDSGIHSTFARHLLGGRGRPLPGHIGQTRKAESSRRRVRTFMRIGPEPMSAKQATSQSTGRPHVAVILANNLGAFGSGSPMPKVGALPILLRSILGAQKAGASRIVVVVDEAKGPRMRR